MVPQPQPHPVLVTSVNFMMTLWVQTPPEPPVEAEVMGKSDLNERKTTSYAPRRLGEWPRLIKSQVRILLTSGD